MFEKQKALKEKEEQEKLQAEEEENRRLEEEREAKRSTVPSIFAANVSRQTTPPKKDEATSTTSNISVEDLQDFIEEVMD